MIPDSIFKVVGMYFFYGSGLIVGALLITLLLYLINGMIGKSMNVFDNWTILCRLKKELKSKESSK